MAHVTWLADYRWAMNAMRARRWRRKIGFAARVEFDTALRPRLPKEPGKVIAYPDALYHITIEDVCRAIEASVKIGTYQ